MSKCFAINYATVKGTLTHMAYLSYGLLYVISGIMKAQQTKVNDMARIFRNAQSPLLSLA